MIVRARLAFFLVTAPCAVACGAPAGGPEAVGTSRSADTDECNSGPYVSGVDVYDGTGTIDFTALKASGYDFAIIKATQGNYDTQKTFATNWAAARAAGVARSAYHFFDPTVDGKAQATYFLGVMGPLEPGDLPPMLDLECPDGDAECLGFAGGSGDETGSVITTRVNDWLAAVQEATGVAPIFYTFGSYFTGAGVDTTGFESYPIDIAYPTTKTCFNVPSPWTSATIWQNSWTATVGGISGQVDTDRFLGTLAQFQAFEVGGFAPPSSYNGSPALTIVSFADEHVELFAHTEKGGAVGVSTTGTGDGWSTPTALDGETACGLASVAWPSKSGLVASVFDAPGGAPVDTTLTAGAFGAFASLGGPDLVDLSTLAFSDGHVEVFGLGAGGVIWHDVWDVSKQAFGGWESLGGAMATGVAGILWGDGHAEIFATDASGVAWHDATPSGTSSAWGGWSALTGGKLATRPIPARWADGHVQIFARGVDDDLYASDNPGGAWPALAAVNAGTAIAGQPSVVVYAAYGPEVFARDPKGELMHAWTEGTALVPWASDFDQVLASDPLAWMRPDGQAEVFGVDGKGNVVKSLHAGASWSSWSTIATGAAACTAIPTVPPSSGDGGAAGAGGRDGGTPGAPDGGEADGGSRPGDATTGPAASGCGCRIGPAGEAAGSWGGIGAVLVGIGRRRRRRA